MRGTSLLPEFGHNVELESLILHACTGANSVVHGFGHDAIPIVAILVFGSAYEFERKNHGRGRSTARALESDRTRMAIDNVAAYPEAEASAQCSLGADKRFEEPAGEFRRDSDSGVLNLQDQPSVPLPIRDVGANGKLPTLSHCIDGVADEIYEDLPYFSCASLEVNWAFNMNLHRNLLLLQFGAEHQERLLNEAFAIDVAEDSFIAIEREGLLGDAGDAIELLVGLFDK